MSKKGFKRLMKQNRVIAIPTHKVKRGDTEVQKYMIVPIEMASNF